jgi:hypothetical protein
VAAASLRAAVRWAALLALGPLALACGPHGARAQTAAPEWAAFGSLLLPGVGQALNGDYAEGAAQAGLYLVLVNQYRQHIDRPDYIPFDLREDESNDTIRINRTTVIADQYATASLDLAFYSSFAAYRDARARPEHANGYRTPAPRESLAELALAPFSTEYLTRPSTLAPLLIPLALALAPAQSGRLVYSREDGIAREELAARFFVQHGAVAVGEEAFYRGVLNNGLSNALGENWGLATSSVLFGLSHEGGAGQANALGAALFGAYLGWVQQRNGYAIGEGVAIHFWWNFLTSIAFLKSYPGATVTPITFELHF